MHTVILSGKNHDVSELICFAAKIGADKYETFIFPDPEECNPETLLNSIYEYLKDIRPDAVIMNELPNLSGIAPALAEKLDMQCITSVEGTDNSSGNINLVRNILGGKAVMKLSPCFPAVITLLPGAFDKSSIECSSDISSNPQSIPVFNSNEEKQKMINLGTSTLRDQQTGPGILEAEVITSAGRGIGSQENLELIRRLSKMFNHSAVAGSRAVIDAGWLPYSAQVGLTGKTVSPKLYIACGISGSPQHIAGMRNSKLIVAVNKDPNAAIFNYSHYCIVEDLFEFIPILIEEIKSKP